MDDSRALVAPTERTAADSSRRLRLYRRHYEGLGATGAIVLLFGAPIGLLIGPIVIADTTADVWGTLIIGAPFGISGIFLSMWDIGHALQYDASARAKRRYNRIVDRRLRRQRRRYLAALRRADHVEGWRPREGAPHPEGRTDTHDRYRVEARADGGTLTLAIARWRYDGDRWTRCERHPATTQLPQRRVDGTDVDAIERARHDLDTWIADAERRALTSAAEGAVVAEAETERDRHVGDVAASINRAPSI